ncbi:MAG: 3-oxoacyl-ACP reductase FabG [Planctomycetes bacterium]|nr:3-oxoacyl-ACP reductase FabG [Planctomycetota bacterium]
MRGLKDKVVIVTGAGRGIGRATALRFAEEGARVVIAERDAEAARGAAEEVLGRGGQAHAAEVDIAERASVRRLVETVVSEHGRIDVLVNNAGVVADATLAKTSDELFEQVLRVNLQGTFVTTQEVAAAMKPRKQGVILNAASVVALYGNFGQTNYVASKAGVIGMTKVWARELGKDGIRVNAVAPGFIETDMTKGIPAKVTEMLVGRVPLQRMGKAEEIAAVYAFLASDDASYITGAVISVDGGVVT